MVAGNHYIDQNVGGAGLKGGWGRRGGRTRLREGDGRQGEYPGEK